MPIAPLNSYVVSNGSTNSTRLLDIDVTKNSTPIQNLRSFLVECDIKSPNVFTLNLSYVTWESNRLVPNDRVFNAITDSMLLELATSTWAVKVDYRPSIVTPELTLTYGSGPATALALASKIEIEFNDQTLHPRFTVQFAFV